MHSTCEVRGARGHMRARRWRFPLQPAQSQRSLMQSYFFVVFIAISASCGKLPTPPYAPSTPEGVLPLAIDADPAWSHDGSIIAFHRRLPSSYGPAGLYVIAAAGGEPRFLAPGDLTWPIKLSFSHDDSYLVCNFVDQLYQVNVATGATRQLFYTPSGAGDPACSPSTDVVLYRRTAYQFGDPLDSVGIHVFNLATGLDSAFRVNGQQIGGFDLAWSPSGDSFAEITSAPTLEYLVTLYSADGTGSRVLVRTTTRNASIRDLRWYQATRSGTGGVRYFLQNGVPHGGVFFVSESGGANYRALDQASGDIAFSPNGVSLVYEDWDPASGAIVLFVRQINDISSASRRRLTHYSQPPGS